MEPSGLEPLTSWVRSMILRSPEIPGRPRRPHASVRSGIAPGPLHSAFARSSPRPGVAHGSHANAAYLGRRLERGKPSSTRSLVRRVRAPLRSPSELRRRSRVAVSTLRRRCSSGSSGRARRASTGSSGALGERIAAPAEPSAVAATGISVNATASPTDTSIHATVAKRYQPSVRARGTSSKRQRARCVRESNPRPASGMSCPRRSCHRAVRAAAPRTFACSIACLAKADGAASSESRRRLRPE